MPTLLDFNQVLQGAYDEPNQRLRVDAEAVIVGGELSVDTTHTEDSMRLGDGTNFFTSTTIGPKVALDVNLINSGLEINIDHNNDSIQVWGTDGTVDRQLKTDTLGQLQVGVVASVLPTNAAQEAGGHLESIDNKIPSGLTVTSNRLLVDNSGVIQPISGSVTVINGAGASAVNIQDGGNSITVDGTVAATQSGIWNINNITGTISLPTGAATEAKQDVGNTSLASIDSKLNTLGQKTSAGSVPVVIASDQSPITVTGTIITSPDVNIHDGAGTSLTSQLNGAQQALDVGINVGGVQIDPRIIKGNSDGTLIGNIDDRLKVDTDIDNIDVVLNNQTLIADGTQSISFNVSEYKEISVVVAITGPVTGTTPTLQFHLYDLDPFGLSVTGNVTDSAIFTTSIVDTIFTHYTKTTQLQLNWTITGTSPSFGGVYVGIVGVKDAIVFGQKTMALSEPVVIASNQTAIPVTQSGTWNINNISGTISLPTGAATAANQVTQITSLQLIDDLPHSQNAALNKGVPFMGQLDDASTTVATEDNVSVVRITAQRAAHVNLRNNSGTEIATSGNPLRIDPTGTTPQPASQSGTWSNRITDGTDIALVTAAGELNVLSTAQPGVDIGDVTVNNAAGAAAVNIQDGGNSLTVDGTISTSNFPTTVDTNFGAAGASTIRTAALIGNSTGAAAFNAGTTSAQTLRVVLPTDQTAIPVTQSGTWTTGRTWTLSSGTDAVSNNMTQVGGASVTLGQKTSANSIPVVLPSDQTLNTQIEDSSNATYSSTTLGLAAALLATDIFTITGSGTKTVKVRKIRITGTRTTSINNDILLIKRSTANSGGTSTAETIIPHDSTDAAATAVVRSYTANPTLGTTVGTVRVQKQFINVAATGPSDVIDWEFDGDISQPLVLRGTSQVLAVNLNGVTITTSSFDIYIEWTEE